MKIHPCIFLIPWVLTACEVPFFSKKDPGPVPRFNEDFAYQAILEYEKRGPAVPGTQESMKTGDWIVSTLKALGIEAIEQKATAETFDHHPIPIRNLLARIRPTEKTRFLLSAHWDARPFADEDPDPKFHKTPVPAVNDGGSGVAILLGIAEALKGKDLPFGVDLLFLDAEDWGIPAREESYCLGTQYFAKHPIPEGYHAQFGINFDMVGRIGATFPIEIYSAQRAGAVVEKIRKAAAELGYGDSFPKSYVGPIVDDHIYLMDGLKFPIVDLIHMTEGGRFPPEWHTHLDTSEFISRTTLKIVGQTTLQVIWNSH
jgi:hypothetical protein